MTTRSGNRLALPANALKVCASCGQPRGNVRKGWEPITRGTELLGYTCPTCPTWTEPIRRVETKAGVRFRLVVDATPPGARQRKQVTKTLPTLDEARAEVESIRAEVRRAGSYQATASETLRALADRWLTSRVGVREVTAEMYRATLASPLRLLGDHAADSLTTADIESLVAWLSASGGRPSKAYPEGRPLKARSVRAAMVALSQVLDYGVKHGAVAANVTKGVELPRQVERVGRDLEHWRPQEMLSFKDHADSDSLAATWRLSLAGLTRADVCGLRWSDVDFDAGTVTVAQGRVQLQLGGQRSVVDEPKSAQRRRTIPVETIWPGTMALLRQLKARQAADKLKVGAAYKDSGFVLVDAFGVPVRPELYSDMFRRVCRDAGVRSIKLHSLRHSLAFWLHSLGVTPADAAALLGHTIEVHLSTYLPDSGQSGIAAAAAALAKATAAV